MTATIKIYLQWIALEAGNFKPVKFVPLPVGRVNPPPLLVEVDVPAKEQYFTNPESVLSGHLIGKEVIPILTLQGMRYVLDAVQDTLEDQPKDFDEEENEELDDDIEPIE